jgi:predicted Zn finger-like uncharacterized protein
MNLYTRCPGCGTTFKVTTQQLQVSGGQVRCGNCQSVFDGFATLTAQEPHPGNATGNTIPGAVSLVPESPKPIDDDNTVPAPRLPASPTSGARADPAATLYEWEFRMPLERRRTGLWLSLSLILALLLGLQAAYYFRTEIMVTAPALRVLYEKSCDILGCAVGLPRLSGYLHIETSDLRVPDPEHPNEIELLVLVRNRASVAMAYPSFELTLIDAHEAAIARRVFMPSEYAKDRPSDSGFPAAAELPVKLYLDTGSLRAAGYRLYLFYP